MAALVKRAVGRSADLIGTKKVVQLHVVGREACVTELHVSVEIEPYFEISSLYSVPGAQTHLQISADRGMANLPFKQPYARSLSLQSDPFQPSIEADVRDCFAAIIAIVTQFARTQ